MARSLNSGASSKHGLPFLRNNPVSHVGRGGLGWRFRWWWVTGMNQRAERRVARWREQLYEFYAPLKAMRAEIEAKIAMRMKLQAAATKCWGEKIRARAYPGTEAGD